MGGSDVSMTYGPSATVRDEKESHVRVVARFRPPITTDERRDAPAFCLLQDGAPAERRGSGLAISRGSQVLVGLVAVRNFL